MADFVFNVAKGRIAEFYNRIDQNDPATAKFTVVVLATSGLESDATLVDSTDLADVLGGTTNEVTNTNYARKDLTDTDIGALTIDHANDRVDLDIPDLVWGPPGPTAGDGWSKIVICYNPTGGADSTIIPCTAHDFVITPDGSTVTAQINAAGFHRSS